MLVYDFIGKWLKDEYKKIKHLAQQQLTDKVDTEINERKKKTRQRCVILIYSKFHCVTMKGNMFYND